MIRKLQLISINHHFFKSEVRRSFDLKLSGWNKLKEQMESLGCVGIAVVSTCNRVELIYEAPRDLRFEVLELWQALRDDETPFNKLDVKTYFGTYLVHRYLLKLSTGMDSAVFGDNQILSQLKKSFEDARVEGRLSTLLERSYQSIMQCHKQISKDTDYKKQGISLAYQALKQVRGKIGKDEMKQKSLLIVGAGEMAIQVLKYVKKFNFKDVFITNRTKSKAEALAEGGPIIVLDYDQSLPHCDVVISCTNQGFEKVNAQCDPELFVDLSLMAASLKDDPKLIKLEALQNQLDIINKKRMSSVAVVKRLMGEHALNFRQWLDQWETRQKEAQAVDAVTSTVA